MVRSKLSSVFTSLIVLFWALSTGAAAQNSTLRGTVKDITGTPLIGVNVIQKGTTNGTVTDVDGNFSINVPANATIVFTYIGFSAQEVVRDGASAMNVVMHEDAELLDEVVVIGYGTVRKSDLTGAVSSIKGKELTTYTVPDPMMALQGKVPGVSISQNTGDPSGDYSIRIRGINSIKGDNSPLFIIDGIPASTSSINTYDIESIEVLKDASASAIYGSRGANGVVLITTKKGTDENPTVSYNFEYGQQSQIKKLDLMNLQEWARFYNEYLINANILTEKPFSDQDIAAMGEGTDWQSLMFKNAPSTQHNLGISGGTNKLQYFVSATALSRDGLIKNSSYSRYNLRSNLNILISPVVETNVQLGYSSIEGFNQSNSGGHGGSSMIGAVYSASPLFTPYDENGNYKDLRSWFSWSSHEVKNPINMAYESTYKNSTNLSNLNASVTFKPFSGFSLKGILGLESSDRRYDGYTTSKYIYQNNSASVNHYRYSNLTNEFIGNYNFNVLDDNSFNVMGAYTYQQYIRRNINASGNSFMSDVTWTNDLGSAGTINTPSTGYQQWVMKSLLGRINYSYKGRYLLTASIRADGSSRYSENNKWGYFPSFALAWRVSDESFMKSFENLSDMKIRFGYGKTGSTAIAPYSTQNLLSSGKTATGNGNYTFYAPGGEFPEDLKWETTSQWDMGLDLGFFNNRFRMTLDYYSKLTTNLLNTVFLPPSSGYNSTVQNIGSMSNKGFELLLEGDLVQTKDFGFTAQFNLSHNKNRVEKLSDGLDIFGTTYNSFGSGSITIIREGLPIGSFYVYKDAGFNEKGSLTYHDFNEDDKLTDTEDRYVAGSPHPDFIYGLNCGFRYKQMELSFFLQGSQGNDVFNLSEMRNYSYSQGMNIERDVYYHSWREGQDNSNARYPRIELVGPLKYSDRFIEDGSFLRLKNILLGYNVPPMTLKDKRLFQAIRFYVSLQNYLTLTKYSGLDPEVNSKGGDINSGIDHFTYPNNKTISFGANITF